MPGLIEAALVRDSVDRRFKTTREEVPSQQQRINSLKCTTTEEVTVWQYLSSERIMTVDRRM